MYTVVDYGYKVVKISFNFVRISVSKPAVCLVEICIFVLDIMLWKITDNYWLPRVKSCIFGSSYSHNFISQLEFMEFY